MKARRAKRSTRQTDGQKAVAYLRLSKDDSALGLDAQRELIVRWAERTGVTIVSFHEDHGVGGATLPEDRPGLTAALDAMRDSGARHLVVAKRDRLARDVMVAAMLERLVRSFGPEASIVTADGVSDADTPEGILMRGIVDLFAQYERCLIRYRTKGALAVKRARLERVGPVAYGFSLAECGIKLNVNPVERFATSLARLARRDGFSYSQIIQMFDLESIRPRHGERWHRPQVARMACGREGGAPLLPDVADVTLARKTIEDYRAYGLRAERKAAAHAG